MNVKTMEGLVGARTNTNLMDTPMRVFHEARLKGDTAAMERALGYAGELEEKAEGYKAKADKGMEEEARETKEKAKSDREKIIQKHREEQEKTEDKMEANRSGAIKEDTVEIGRKGDLPVNDNLDLEYSGSNETKANAVQEAVTYTKTGEVIHMEASGSISVIA